METVMQCPSRKNRASSLSPLERRRAVGEAADYSCDFTRVFLAFNGWKGASVQLIKGLRRRRAEGRMQSINSVRRKVLGGITLPQREEETI